MSGVGQGVLGVTSWGSEFCSFVGAIYVVLALRGDRLARCKAEIKNLPKL